MPEILTPRQARALVAARDLLDPIREAAAYASFDETRDNAGSYGRLALRLELAQAALAQVLVTASVYLECGASKDALSS